MSTTSLCLSWKCFCSKPTEAHSHGGRRAAVTMRVSQCHWSREAAATHPSQKGSRGLLALPLIVAQRNAAMSCPSAGPQWLSFPHYTCIALPPKRPWRRCSDTTTARRRPRSTWRPRRQICAPSAAPRTKGVMVGGSCRRHRHGFDGRWGIKTRHRRPLHPLPRNATTLARTTTGTTCRSCRRRSRRSSTRRLPGRGPSRRRGAWPRCTGPLRGTRSGGSWARGRGWPSRYVRCLASSSCRADGC